jgi:signal transduction histidine kinase
VTARRAGLLAGAAGGALGGAFALLADLGVPGAVLGAIVGGALGLVGVRPRAAWVIAACAGLALAPVGLAWGVQVLLAIHVFFAARSEPRVPAAIALAALLFAMELEVGLADDEPVPGFVVAVAAWAAGLALRERELVAAQLAERARELEDEREAHAALSVRYERARIASDLHDIVAHAITVMVIQAGAGQRVSADPAATAETFDAIAGAAEEAQRDMGRLVAMLGDETRERAGPDPDGALVEQLVTTAADGGLDVTLRFEGERDAVPDRIAAAIRHVVREGLTNALRYAAGASVAVTVRGDPGEILVAIENGAAAHDAALAGTGTGTGIRGLRERVAACGGAIEAGPTPEGGWRLAARLPRRAG